MKTNKLKLLLAGLLLSSTQAMAGLVSHVWTDTYDPVPDRLVPPAVTHVFDISAVVDGYRPGLDLIVSYWLEINLYDDADDAGESARVNLPGQSGDADFGTVAGPEFGGFSIQAWHQLDNNGKLQMTVSRLTGDFYFGDAKLSVSGFRYIPGYLLVPEPGSLALAGLALTGLGLSRRKHKA